MKKLLFLAGILTLMASCQCGKEKLSPVLSIEGGQVQGVSADRVKGVYVFRGIPYAAAPIRENRWKAPQPVTPWEGVKLCNRLTIPAISTSSTRVVTTLSGVMVMRLLSARIACI